MNITDSKDFQEKFKVTIEENAYRIGNVLLQVISELVHQSFDGEYFNHVNVNCEKSGSYSNDRPALDVIVHPTDDKGGLWFHLDEPFFKWTRSRTDRNTSYHNKVMKRSYQLVKNEMSKSNWDFSVKYETTGFLWNKKKIGKFVVEIASKPIERLTNKHCEQVEN